MAFGSWGLGFALQDVKAGLQAMYKKYLLPLESDFKFQQFYSPLLTDGDFAAKPMVMVLGQYSTGKVNPRAPASDLLACYCFTAAQPLRPLISK